ncbi:DUF1877 family protein [Neolewinella agarilytica]|uniref:DUF1877 family protein n=1 Tax=Neolewinella agarilytica TaxID=478744 RepID=A0A1H9P418_9BACT|nr:DUF1877 family protein [Neolewinella agarilytica]SER42861.1 protein of unknown function [Neolewinella agarilytica]
MGMTASLTRIKSVHLDHLLNQEPLPGDPEEELYVDKDWESIMYVFGNGSVGAPITGDIFMPEEVIGDEEAIQCGEGIRYHTPEAVKAINVMISDLTEASVRELIVPEKMEHIYSFHPDETELLVERCLSVIELFKRAEQNGDLVIAGMG